MKLTRGRALTGALGLGLGLFGLTACESHGTFAATCRAVPTGVSNPTGVVDASIDTPLPVHPGDTFTLTVNDVGSQDGQVTNPPTADAASMHLTNATNPAGDNDVSIGSLSNPAVFPWTTTITVTGQVGRTIDISLVSAAQISGLGAIICTPSTTATLVSINIVAP
jgi:hypothetical protein